MVDIHPTNETLDPQDWAAMRALGHCMLDDTFTYLEGVREMPVWQPMPASLKVELHAPLPADPQSPEEVYEEFLRLVMPYSLGNAHPRFWGWVIGTGTPLGVLAELLAAGLNPNVWGGNQSPVEVERQVLDWLKEMLGFSHEASGLLVSGGSMANLIGLAVARNSRAGYDVRQADLQGAPKALTIYGSTEVHSSI